MEHGLDGIIVSNHGGRQLDWSLATLDALPEIVEAVDGRLEVLMDGGIRRGTDVLKALALGARAVLIGRPVLWGLGAGGTDGVLRMVELIRGELVSAMGHTASRRRWTYRGRSSSGRSARRSGARRQALDTGLRCRNGASTVGQFCWFASGRPSLAEPIIREHFVLQQEYRQHRP